MGIPIIPPERRKNVLLTFIFRQHFKSKIISKTNPVIILKGMAIFGEKIKLRKGIDKIANPKPVIDIRVLAEKTIINVNKVLIKSLISFINLCDSYIKFIIE